MRNFQDLLVISPGFFPCPSSRLGWSVSGPFMLVTYLAVVPCRCVLEIWSRNGRRDPQLCKFDLKGKSVFDFLSISFSKRGVLESMVHYQPTLKGDTWCKRQIPGIVHHTWLEIREVGWFKVFFFLRFFVPNTNIFWSKLALNSGWLSTRVDRGVCALLTW